jgi:virginiamycin B lyase
LLRPALPIRPLIAIVLLLTSLFALAQTPSDPVESIDAWQVPWRDTRPRDPYVGPQGRVWFNGQTGNYLAFLDPDDGSFTRFELPARTGPHNLVVDGEGFVWYAGNRNAHIGRLDPDSGDIVQFPMPESGASDPHTLIFGEGDALWFTLQRSNMIGRLDRVNGEIDLIPVPTPRALPYGIKLAPNGVVWVVLFGSNRLARIDPDTLELTEIALPREGARPRRLEVDAQGAVWYVDYAEGFLGRYLPDVGTFAEWLLPSGSGSAPYGTALDHRGRIWIAETGPFPNRLVAFDPASETFVADHQIEAGGSARHMVFHAPTRQIWFAVDTGSVVRVQLNE